MQTKAQHYIPRFLLKNFCNRDGKIYVYDIKKSSSRLQVPSKIAFANHIYTLDIKGEDPESLEKALANIESETAPIVRGLLSGRQLSSLVEDERITLAVFMACQLPRVYKIRSYFESIKGLRQTLSMNASGISFEVTKGPDDPRLAQINLIHYAAHNISQVLLNMTWLLISPAEGETFLISDNPVTVYNTFEASKMVNLYKHLQTIYPNFREIKNIKEHFENLLAQPGIEICFPLSPKLAIFCVYPHVAGAANLPVEGNLTLESSQATYVNLLQGKAAERYLYSIEKLDEPQIPSEPDEIREIIVKGLTEAFIDYNFIMQRTIKNSGAQATTD